MLLQTLLIQILLLGTPSSASLPPIHYTLSRRGNSFPAPDTANLTYLLEQLQIVERRYSSTTRTPENNKLVRRPKPNHETQGNTILLGDVGREGNWFATLHIGDPVQTVDMDLDMLTSDWWVLSTTSGTGSFYLDFNSRTFNDSRSIGFPTCREPSDVVHLPTTGRTVPVSFVHCRPAKQFVRTLLPSGAYLGLAPSKSLSQTKKTSFLDQLLEMNVIDTPIWSVMLINGKEGVFTVGENAVPTVKPEKLVEVQTGNHEEIKRSIRRRDGADISLPAESPSRDWTWSELTGAEAWWQIIMEGIWVEGSKVLDNEPIILDINTPFIMAPPKAARTLYASISGSRRLAPPFDQFHTYPCLNPPELHFEFNKWKAHALKWRRDRGTFSPGGRFSLGIMTEGSGYCIGIVVESRMSDEKLDEKAQGSSGLENVWIIGEPFFRDVQVAFDWKNKLVGLRRA